MSTEHIKRIPRPKRYIDQILALIERHDFKLEVVPKSELPGGAWGTCVKEERLIRIWEKLSLHARTLFFVHECLHLLYPEKSEEWVTARAYRVWGFAKADEHEKIVRFLEAHRG